MMNKSHQLVPTVGPTTVRGPPLSKEARLSEETYGGKVDMQSSSIPMITKTPPLKEKMPIVAEIAPPSIGERQSAKDAAEQSMNSC